MAAAARKMLEKLLPGQRIRGKRATKRAGDHASIGLLDSAHHSAQVQAFDDYANPVRVQAGVYEIGDLAGHPFLDLQPAGEEIDNPRYFLKAHYLSVWQIGDMRLAKEWQHVMLAQAVEFDVAHDHHLVVLLVEDGIVDQPLWIGP